MTLEISFDVEVPGTPEEVWAAISTSRGISGWFAPTEISGDEMTQHHGNGFDMTSRITATERPARFAYEDEFRPGADAEPAVIATEFSVSARSGGTCVVRVVQSGFGTRRRVGARDRELHGRLARRARRPAPLPDALRRRAGRRLRHRRAPGRAAGERLARSEGRARAARAARRRRSHPDAGHSGLRRHDRPRRRQLRRARARRAGRGLGYLGAGGPTGETFAFVRARLFGDGAPTVAAREEAAWESWLANAPATA